MHWTPELLGLNDSLPSSFWIDHDSHFAGSLAVVDWEFAGPIVEVHDMAGYFITDPDNRIHGKIHNISSIVPSDTITISSVHRNAI
jgi:hypothetical protein